MPYNASMECLKGYTLYLVAHSKRFSTLKA